MLTKVEYESDPRLPGRTAVRISAATKEAVQAEITRAMRAAECMTGHARFIGPARIIGGFGALGEVLIDP